MFKSICFALLLALVCAGCRSDIHYQHRAAERARRFLLENCRELSWEESMFVRYNPPVLLHAPVLGGTEKGTPEAERLHSQLHQICVTWLIPGRKDLVMVFGVSSPRMDFWQPNRIIIRDYPVHIPVMDKLMAIGRDYARDNFFSNMSAKEINQVRFSYPAMIRTDFALNFDPQGKSSDAELAAALENAAGKTQYSLVWKFGGNRNLVITGLSGNQPESWQVMMAEIMDDEMLKKHTVAVILTPEQGLEAMPEKELDKLQGWEE